MDEAKNSWDEWTYRWRRPFEQFASQEMLGIDASHDIYHVQRVVNNARRIGQIEQADSDIVLPAAWLHDCVNVPKDSPLRSQASRLAASRALEFLESVGYAEQLRFGIAHAIAAHSFSAQITPETIEAKVVQDADRLEALGALGLARCLMTGGALGQRLFDPEEPFPVTRAADDSKQSIDHFFCKLLRLPGTMQTVHGKAEADRRAQVLIRFLKDLSEEIGFAQEQLTLALMEHFSKSNASSALASTDVT